VEVHLAAEGFDEEGLGLGTHWAKSSSANTSIRN
jgi:hypothetical protein